jgi:pyridoxamine 5'-phosphate oxidase family protein
VAYLRSQRLARLATVAPDGQPDVVPVGFEVDGTHIYVGGMDPVNTRKFSSVQGGNIKVALVIDDLVSVAPWCRATCGCSAPPSSWTVRAGSATLSCMHITPTISWRWTLDGRGFSHDREVLPHRTVHQPATGQTTDKRSYRSTT